MRGTLTPLNLSHMDFLGRRAVTTTCTDPIPCTTNSASPNEHKYPEIWMKNPQNPRHSFPGSWPAIFLAEYYSSCACVVLLSEASSSSHVLFLIARQRGTFASERSKIRRRTSPTQNSVKCASCAGPCPQSGFLISIFWAAAR